jgi:hypothetical protein
MSNEDPKHQLFLFSEQRKWIDQAEGNYFDKMRAMVVGPRPRVTDPETRLKMAAQLNELAHKFKTLADEIIFSSTIPNDLCPLARGPSLVERQAGTRVPVIAPSNLANSVALEYAFKRVPQRAADECCKPTGRAAAPVYGTVQRVGH